MRKRIFTPFSVLIIFVFFLIIGISLIQSLSINLLPSQYLPSISIHFDWAGTSARVIEREATSKIEAEFSKISEVERITSTSTKGSASINIVFNKGTDMEMARFKASVAISNIRNNLPADISYPIISIDRTNKNSDLILTYSLYSENAEEAIANLIENHIQPEISRIEGVGAFEMFNTPKKVLQIAYNNEKLQLLGLDISIVSEKLLSYLNAHNLGFAQERNESLETISIRIDGLNTSKINWQELPIAKSNGKIIYLGDFSKITNETLPQDSYTRINGFPTVGFNIYKAKGANAYRISSIAKNTIHKILNATNIHANIQKTYDAAAYLNQEFSKILYRTIIALVILLAFILLITKSWKYLIIIILTVIFNLALSAILAHLLNVEIHIYALAGLTISFGMIIDNAIIIIDHIRYNRKHSAFLSVFAATLTTIGALSVILFLDYKTQLNLIDFGLVVIICLATSLLLALLFIPAIMHYWPLTPSQPLHKKLTIYRKIRFNSFYEKIIQYQLKIKWFWIVSLILIFGLPINELPTKIEKDKILAKWYNQTIGSEFYQKKLNEPLKILLGGTYRLFSKYIFEAGVYGEIGETKLTNTAYMPQDASLEFANSTIKKIERFLTGNEGVSIFKTNIRSPELAIVEIAFKEKYANSGYPDYLKTELQKFVQKIDGVSWRIEGVGPGFSNTINNSINTSHIMLYGYNYEQLLALAQKTHATLTQNKRVKELTIMGNAFGNKVNRTQIVAHLDDQMLAKRKISPSEIFHKINAQVSKPVFIGHVKGQTDFEELYITPISSNIQKWDLLNYSMCFSNENLRLNEIGKIEQLPIGFDINKTNQEYQLAIGFSFAGSDQLERKFRKEVVQKINEELPIGYRAAEPDYAYWKIEKMKIGHLIPIVVFIIFLILSILFESLKQPLAILSLIFISFSGIFLTFYWFDIQFDQGGYASFILIAGISVNASLYIVNEYNVIKHSKKLPNIKIYLKAYSNKIVPILLTITSTILGLSPFILYQSNEPFWFAFAAGSIGGLIFSLIGLIFWLPPLLLKNRNAEKRNTNSSIMAPP